MGPEIDRVAHALGTQLKAKVTGRTVTAGGEQAWQYDLVHGDVFEQLTFVLRGKTSTSSTAGARRATRTRPCDRLVSSFRLR